MSTAVDIQKMPKAKCDRKVNNLLNFIMSSIKPMGNEALGVGGRERGMISRVERKSKSPLHAGRKNRSRSNAPHLNYALSIGGSLLQYMWTHIILHTSSSLREVNERYQVSAAKRKLSSQVTRSIKVDIRWYEGRDIQNIRRGRRGRMSRKMSHDE